MRTRKRAVFAGLLAVLGLVVVGLLVWLAGWWVREPPGGEMDPGMFRYEPTLGWELAPDWAGRHWRREYDVAYRVNRLGFRADTRFADDRSGPLVAVVGDSFTFGLGVGDDETFVHALDAGLRPGGCAANFAVPGTSTDQQALLLERRLVHFRPAVVVVVVYLANDLIDILRAYPVQAANAKPFFALGPAGLELRNVPVPQQRQPVDDARAALRHAILGEAEHHGDAADRPAAIEAGLDASLTLFEAIVDRMAGACEPAGAELVLALLAGRSHLERPRSLSAQYQEHARARILAWAEGQALPVIDLAGALRERAAGARTGWYFRRDGHLTPAGHQVVAELLLSELAGRAARAGEG